MITIEELRGTNLKRDLGLRQVLKRWHNHNNTGGNFGINLMTIKEPNYEITGYHNLDNNITSLSFGELYQPGVVLFRSDTMHEWTYNRLISLIKKKLESPESPGWTQDMWRGT